jgi:hypothetical protein
MFTSGSMMERLHKVDAEIRSNVHADRGRMSTLIHKWWEGLQAYRVAFRVNSIEHSYYATIFVSSKVANVLDYLSEACKKMFQQQNKLREWLKPKFPDMPKNKYLQHKHHEEG